MGSLEHGWHQSGSFEAKAGLFYSGGRVPPEPGCPGAGHDLLST